MSKPITVEISVRQYGSDDQKGKLKKTHEYTFSSIDDVNKALNIVRVICDETHLFTTKQPHEMQIKTGLNKTTFINWLQTAEF